MFSYRFFIHKIVFLQYTVNGSRCLRKSKRFKWKFAKQCFPSNCLVRLEFINPTMAI